MDECGENFYVIQRFETFEVQYNETYPLTVSTKSHQYCVGSCINKKILCPQKIEINNGNIYTGFDTGSIYINYLQKLEHTDSDGVDLIIPDYAPIRDWIKESCVYKIFQVSYRNGVVDVQQRYNDAKMELTILEANAKSFARRSEFSELYDMRKVFFGRYDKFNQMIYGNNKNR